MYARTHDYSSLVSKLWHDLIGLPPGTHALPTGTTDSADGARGNGEFQVRARDVTFVREFEFPTEEDLPKETCMRCCVDADSGRNGTTYLCNEKEEGSRGGGACLECCDHVETKDKGRQVMCKRPE